MTTVEKTKCRITIICIIWLIGEYRKLRVNYSMIMYDVSFDTPIDPVFMITLT